MPEPRWLSSADDLVEIDRIAESVRHAVVTGSIAPGQQLLVRDLSEIFQATEESVGYALARLRNDGVVIQRGNSFAVRSLDYRELSSISRMWALVGGELAAGFSRIMQAEDARDFTEETLAIQAHRETPEHSHRLRIAQDNWYFRGAGSSWERLTYAQLNDWFWPQMHTYYTKVLAHEEYQAQLAEFLSAIRRGDPAATRADFRQMMEIGHEILKQALPARRHLRAI